MFALFNLAGTLSVWKTNYCEAQFERCHRYKTACAGQEVQVNLLPNGRLLRKVGLSARVDQ